jgi:hypothetical protein
MKASAVGQLFSGILITTSLVTSLFFLRFWTQTRDRFFAFFASAFGVMALNWLGLAFTSPADEYRPYLYLLRLLAFLFILVGVWDKNRGRS